MDKIERIDDTGFGGIRVIQNPGMGYGVDSVLLAAFAAGETGAKPIRKGARVADLGSGSGIVGFVLYHKLGDAEITGIEKRAGAVDRAVRAAEMNGFGDRISFVNAEVCGYESDIPYDAVVSNPPYFRQAGAIPNSDNEKYTARHETTADIFDFIHTAAGLLREGGNCYFVHRPDRLADIISGMRAEGLEPKTLQFVVPKSGEAANIVLIHGIKSAGPELKMLPEIAVHSEDGCYTDIINKLYERDVPRD